MSKCPYCKDKGRKVHDTRVGTTTSIRDLVSYCTHCSVGKQLASPARRSDPEDEARAIRAVVVLIIP